jgi:SAM-dependent methyltransferase
MRPCEICNSSDLEPIHRQHFLFPGQDAPVHYDVVACRHCGFAFASDIPDQSTLNRFYQAAEHHLHTRLPPGLARIHREFFEFIREHAVPALSPATRVLDIGAGMGHFLSHFRQAGLQRLLGIEPSAAAARLGKEAYGLEIRNETIDTLALPEPFDLVSLCGVLEHIADLKASLEKIGALVDEGGHLFLAVPDAATFGAAPPVEAFLEFALEHINFFTATSLDTLLRQAGFTAVRVESRHNDFYGNRYLFALYRKTAAQEATVPQPDTEAAASLRAYVELSRQRLSPIADTIAQLVDGGEPLIVWGAGSLTSRLICDTRLGEANIRFIVDRNAGLHGQKLLRFPIVAPDAVRSSPDTTVLIASTTYASEISATLTGDYGWHGRIITLDTTPAGDRP